MPDEYISRETALKDFEASNAHNSYWTPQRVKTLLLRQPAADVAEVVLPPEERTLDFPVKYTEIWVTSI